MRLAEQRDVAGVLAEAVGAQLDLQRRSLRRRRTASRGPAPAAAPRPAAAAWTCRCPARRRRASSSPARCRRRARSRTRRCPSSSARLSRAADVAQPRRRPRRCRPRRARACRRAPRCAAARGRGLRRGDLLDQRVPLAAHVAAPRPLGVVGAALGAAVDGLGLGAHAARGHGDATGPARHRARTSPPMRPLVPPLGPDCGRREVLEARVLLVEEQIARCRSGRCAACRR